MNTVPHITDAVAVGMRDLWKSFPGVQALRSVTLEVRRGEVHALLGGNGSGKSTLLKILAGVEKPDRGSIDFDAESYDDGLTPSQAQAAGLRFVHQQETIFLHHSVAENLAVGRHFARGKFGRISWRQLHREAAEIIDRFDVRAAPDDLMGDLRPATQRMVMIARALADEAGPERVLVLDEPTAALPTPDAEELLLRLRAAADRGQTILYVTHRLDEPPGFADRATVLRDGEVVGRLERSAIVRERLVELIVGKEGVPATVQRRGDRVARELRLRVRGLVSGPIQEVNLDVKAGEVVGLAGLIGSGRSTLLRTIFGDLRRDRGTIEVDGRPVSFRSPAHARQRGVAYVSEDRSNDAGFHEMSLAENLTAASVGDFFQACRLRKGLERQTANELIDTYRIRTASSESSFGGLSGGNQQKAVIARWMCRSPSLILLDEPTQGVDVHSRAEIHRMIRAAADSGAGVLLATSDFEELLSIADRLVVLVRGVARCEFPIGDVSRERLSQLAFGGLAP